ncbi:hypothetical protein P879_00995 [Paragonimus westermani]|uniref:Protein kinase domain-containing protein n=1 Tax=Paragonimus westermani TaxID=34504 RepID=A0A8T0DWW7_9TREM|nr:hypothetical protein P879_00995 [Paragonimus westermani]
MNEIGPEISVDLLMRFAVRHNEAEKSFALCLLEKLLENCEFRNNFITTPDSIPVLLTILAQFNSETLTGFSCEDWICRTGEGNSETAVLRTLLDSVCPMMDKRAILPANVYAAAALARICAESGVPDKIRAHGGIPILLSCLRELTVKDFLEYTARKSDRTQTMDRLPPEPIGSDTDSLHVKRISQLALSSAVCGTLGELASEEFTAQLIVRGNGVHLIGSQLLLAVRKVPQSTVMSNDDALYKNESCNRVEKPGNFDKPKGLSVMDPENRPQFSGTGNLLRLYRFERSRRLIKSLLPASLLAELVELEGIRRDMKDYYSLLDRFERLTVDERCRLMDGVSACDLDKPPTHLIRDYAILELLGSGAFGQVYKARKNIGTPSQTVYAIKEINTTQANFGRNTQERQKNVNRLLNEVNIIKQQLRHPNIVRYYKTFIHGKITIFQSVYLDVHVLPANAIG